MRIGLGLNFNRGRKMIDANGTCLCGGVTWEAKIDPDKIAICHCTQCQVNGSSAFQWAAIINMRDLSLSSDSLKSFVKTAESGNQREINFCENCGTTIFGGNVDNDETVTLRLGGCAQRDILAPKFEIWCDSAQSWSHGLSGGPTIAKQTGIVTE
jgi:hypothetical protein